MSEPYKLTMSRSPEPKVFILTQHLRGVDIHDYRICWARPYDGPGGAITATRMYLNGMHPNTNPKLVMVPLTYRNTHPTAVVWTETTYDLDKGRSCYYVLHCSPRMELSEVEV